MKNFFISFVASMVFIASPVKSFSQPPEKNSAENIKEETQKNLFKKEEVLEIQLYGDVRDLVNDRGEESPERDVMVIYKDDNGKNDSIPAKSKTRGHFRKSSENCIYPPLYVIIDDSVLQSSTFKKKEKLKLVVACTNDDYVVSEWLVYKLYNLITPLSLQARLVRLTLTDSKKGKSFSTMYGILLESDKDMAERNKQKIIEDKIAPKNLDADQYLRMAMFQYMVGNTDWSVEFRQNIIILNEEGKNSPMPVAYDFDHSGFVNAPYAKPAEELNMLSVTDRRYRGYCIEDISVYDPVIKEYNSHKDEIYAIINNCKYVGAKYKSNQIKFLDEFYKTINDPKAFKKDFLYPCDKNGTGNIIIRGLKN